MFAGLLRDSAVSVELSIEKQTRKRAHNSENRRQTKGSVQQTQYSGKLVDVPVRLLLGVESLPLVFVWPGLSEGVVHHLRTADGRHLVSASNTIFF